MPKGKLSFEDWFNINSERVNIELAETGADRELCFDVENEFEKRYFEYYDKK